MAIQVGDIVRWDHPTYPDRGCSIHEGRVMDLRPHGVVELVETRTGCIYFPLASELTVIETSIWGDAT
jgi:hypothetical protein